MATTKGIAVQLDANIAAEYALAAATDITFPLSGPGSGAVLLLDNSSGSAAASFKVVGGNGYLGMADLTISVPAGKTYAVSVESAAYRQTHGEHKGCVHITASGGTPKAALVALPQYHLT